MTNSHYCFWIKHKEYQKESLQGKADTNHTYWLTGIWYLMLSVCDTWHVAWADSFSFYYVFRECNLRTPRTSSVQHEIGKKIKKREKKDDKNKTSTETKEQPDMTLFQK